MTVIQRLAVTLLGAALLSGCAQLPQNNGADLVLTNARIYTVDTDAPWAEAVAITGDRFVYVGDRAGAEAFVGDNTVRHDLGGRFVMPGIIDGHTHPGLMGMQADGPPLPQSGHEDLLEAVKAYAEANPGEGWLTMCCWPVFEYLKPNKTGPQKADIDAVVSDRPVWITSSTWHSHWLNSKGLETLGIDAATPDPAPGVAVYVRDDNGEPTGWIKEGAGWQFMAKQSPPDIQLVRDGIDRSLEILSSHGVTTIYDGGNLDFEDEVYGYLSELDAAEKLPLRYEGTYMVYLPERRHLAVREMKRLRTAYGGERLRFRTIKLFMDGVTPELASGVSEPFTGFPGESGGTTLSVEALRDWLLVLHEEQFDLHVHGIGDLAIKKVLDGVAAAKAIVGESFYPRLTIAHLELIHPDDWARFGELGVTANFTPWWHGRAIGGPGLALLGEERSRDLYPANEIIEAGGNVTFSSDDWGADVLTPFLGIQVGHNRQFPDHWLKDTDVGELQSPEADRIALQDIVKGYTIRGAYPFRMEDEIGSIEVGKSADLVVLDDNLFEVDRRSIHAIKPAAGMLEGKVIHGKLTNEERSQIKNHRSPRLQ